MSNEKMAATMHGGDKSLELTIQAAEVRGYACGVADGKYHQRPTAEDWAAARRWAADYGYRTQQPETTGEHTVAKLADNLYGGVTGVEAAHNPRWEEFKAAAAAEAWKVSELGNPFGAVPGVPADPAPSVEPVHYGWTPTPKELVYAGLIVLAMVGVVLYVVLRHPM